MESIVFTADIQNGVIKLPDEYKNLPKKAKIKIIFIPYGYQRKAGQPVNSNSWQLLRFCLIVELP
jgi:hypothetical protein